MFLISDIDIIIIRDYRDAKPLRPSARNAKGLFLRHLQDLSRCNTRVTADQVDPGGKWPSTGTLHSCDGRSQSNWRCTNLCAHSFITVCIICPL